MRAVALVLATSVAGCKVTATFTCDQSTQCGIGGTCEANGLCAFPDPTCLSGLSYGDYSGDLSGVCVGEEDPADAAGDPIDARVDATPDDPCLSWTFAPAEFDPCAIPVPLDTGLEIVGGTWTLDGTTGVLTDGTTITPLAHTVVNGVAIVSVDHLTLTETARVRGTGAMSLVIASWNTITIDPGATFDVSSSTIGGRGAGAGGPGCAASSGPGVGGGDANGDSGSGGGGYGHSGGDGGKSSNGDNNGGTGEQERALPTIIEGGCDGAAAPVGASGGAGGGALALIARTSIALAGTIHAGGAGGGGGTAGKHAGAGGGSGGMIKLESEQVSLSASTVLAANGGQGGGGAGTQPAFPGQDGQPSTNAANSSNASSGGGPGGRGGARGSPQGQTANNAPEGAGGGGAGVGYIIYKGHTSMNIDVGVTMSPDGMMF